MARSSARITGIDDAIMRLSRLSDQMKEDVSNTTEAYARKIANEAADAAPVRHGFLQNSIASSPTQVDAVTWEFGSDLPYAMRQEYEHATDKGFMRNSIEANRESYYGALRRIAEGR